MENGVKLFADHNYPAALVEFRAAYDARPNANPLVNIALCDKEMFRYPQAIQALKEALAKHGGAMVPADKQAAEEAIKEMAAILGTVTLAVTPRGATVVVDGEELPPGAADQPIKLGPGAHKIAARADGYKAEERSFTISSGLDEKIAIALVPVPPPPPGPVVEPPPILPPPDAPKKEAPPTRGIYLLGLGALLFPTTHATGWPNTQDRLRRRLRAARRLPGQRGRRLRRDVRAQQHRHALERRRERLLPHRGEPRRPRAPAHLPGHARALRRRLRRRVRRQLDRLHLSHGHSPCEQLLLDAPCPPSRKPAPSAPAPGTTPSRWWRPGWRSTSTGC